MNLEKWISKVATTTTTNDYDTPTEKNKRKVLGDDSPKRTEVLGQHFMRLFWDPNRIAWRHLVV